MCTEYECFYVLLCGKDAILQTVKDSNAQIFLDLGYTGYDWIIQGKRVTSYAFENISGFYGDLRQHCHVDKTGHRGFAVQLSGTNLFSGSRAI